MKGLYTPGRLLLFAGLVLTGISFWVFFQPPKPSPLKPESFPNEIGETHFPDPRLLYSGPLKNIHPSVQYVGDAKCQQCHPSIGNRYRDSSMARSMIPIEQIAPKQDYSLDKRNPFEAFQSTFFVEFVNNRVFHHRKKSTPDGKEIFDFSMPVDYAIGSGARGHSYMTNRDGFLFQTVISWYSQKKIWDVSPGFQGPLLAGRPIISHCLFCHTNPVTPVEGSVNRYKQPVFPHGVSIGCERCHGPGELHVKSHAPTDPVTENFDPTIVNPRHLDWQKREAVCYQCHFEGDTFSYQQGMSDFDFRPGLPLDDVIVHFVRLGTKGSKSNKAVNHVVQMHQSVCFQKSANENKLGCISCHDPHQAIPPQQSATFYRKKCQQCHESSHSPCSLPLAKRMEKNQNNCFACHMPHYKASDIPHTAATDHRILKLPQADSSDGPNLPRLEGLVPYGKSFDPKDLVMKRHMGCAIIRLHDLGKPLTQNELFLAVELLETSIKKWPGDLPAWEAYAFGLRLLNRKKDSLATYQTILRKSPRFERVLADAIPVAQQLGQLDLALEYGQKVVDLNPYMPAYRRLLIQLLVARKEYPKAREQIDAWIQLDPASPEARLTLANYYLLVGNPQMAEQIFSFIRSMQPPNLEELIQVFENLKKTPPPQ